MIARWRRIVGRQGDAFAVLRKHVFECIVGHRRLGFERAVGYRQADGGLSDIADVAGEAELRLRKDEVRCGAQVRSHGAGVGRRKTAGELDRGVGGERGAQR